MPHNIAIPPSSLINEQPLQVLKSFPEPGETENKDHSYYLNKMLNSFFYSSFRDALTKNKNLSDTSELYYSFKAAERDYHRVKATIKMYTAFFTNIHGIPWHDLHHIRIKAPNILNWQKKVEENFRIRSNSTTKQIRVSLLVHLY